MDREDIEAITNWLMVRDTNGELRNLLLYQKENKAEAARQLLVDTRMGQTQLGVTREKTRDKIGSMTALYKTWRNKADETSWGLDAICHDQVTRGNSIREVLIQKCPWYCQFEEIMSGSPTVSPPFLWNLVTKIGKRIHKTNYTAIILRSCMRTV